MVQTEAHVSGPRAAACRCTEAAAICICLFLLLLVQPPACQAWPQPASSSANTPPPRATAAAIGPSKRPADGLPPLIPLQLLLGTAKYRDAKLSPDAKYLAYLRPSGPGGVYNVFVKPLPDLTSLGQTLTGDRSLFDREGVEADAQITFDERRGITTYSWAGDGSAILYLKDNDGDEQDHLYLVPTASATAKSAGRLGGGSGSSGGGGGASDGPPASKKSASAYGSPTIATLENVTASAADAESSRPAATDLTPFPGVKASGVLTDKRSPKILYVGLNKRDPELFDMYKVDLATKKVTLDTVNPGGLQGWIMDYNFVIKGATGYNNTDGSSYVLVNDATPSTAAAPPAPKGAAATSPAPALPSIGSLFEEAKAGNWTFSDWVAASTSKSDAGRWRRLLAWPFEEQGGVLRFSKKGDSMFIASSVGRDTAEVQLVSTSPGARVLQRVAANPYADVSSVLFEPDEWQPQIVFSSYLRPSWTVLDRDLAPDWGRLAAYIPGAVPVLKERSNNKMTWLVEFSESNRTTRVFLYRRGSWPPLFLFEMQPELNRFPLVTEHPVVITARDGLKLPSYLTLPAWPGVPKSLPRSVTGDTAPLSGVPAGRSGAAGTGSAGGGGGGAGVKSVHFSTPQQLSEAAQRSPLNLSLPLVLRVHGGPWERDTWGADGTLQWLANRGYAVLLVNFRGSSGFGKAFLNLGDREWGIGTMQHDLTDAVRWAVSKGIADPGRVCIYGASYGGYATLAGLAFTPELYRCGVDMFGISNVATLMNSIPPYWRPMRYELETRVGAADLNATLNRAISPLFHAGSIQAPLLIAAGANDVRVPMAEADQIFKAMKSRGLGVEYVLYPDEGHGLVRPANRIDFYSRMEQFLAKHLGGRKEPPARVQGSSAKVITQVAAPAAPAPASRRLPAAVKGLLARFRPLRGR